MPDEFDRHPPVDPTQVGRIENVHRGLLYQHAYAGSCMLLGVNSPVEAIVVERDEDIELDCGDEGRWYLQVKNLSSPLRYADLKSFVESRVPSIAAEHRPGGRPGAPRFVLVSATAPGPDLASRIADPSWPNDVAVTWPGADASTPDFVPSPRGDVVEALAQCAELASRLPRSSLRPETLALKLAGLGFLLGSGRHRRSHRIRSDEVLTELELVTAPLHSAPTVPQSYQAPDLVEALGIQGTSAVVVGSEGTGKSSLAAYLAVCLPGSVVYVDCRRVAGSDLAATVALEVIARTPSLATLATAAVQPDIGGFGLLSEVDRDTEKTGRTLTIVVDNAHQLSAEAIIPLTEATSQVRWMFLCRPSSVTDELEVKLQTSRLTLHGWTRDEVARVSAEQGRPLSPRWAESLRSATGGIALYVLWALSIARERDVSVERVVQELETGLGVDRSPGELLLERVLTELPAPEARSLAVLARTTLPLSTSGLLKLLREVHRYSQPLSMAAIRRLRSRGLIDLQAEKVQLHDSLASARAGLVATSEIGDCLDASILDLLDREILASTIAGEPPSLRAQPVVERCRLLSRLGRIDEAIDSVAGLEEELREAGLRDPLTDVLRGLVDGAGGSPWLHFWATDILAFLALDDESVEMATTLVDELERLAPSVPPQARSEAAGRLAHKRVLLAGLVGNVGRLKTEYRQVRSLVPAGPLRNIIDYSAGCGFFAAGRFGDAARIALGLVGDQLEALDATWDEPLMLTVPCLRGRQDPNAAVPTRHLADSMELLARSIHRGELKRPTAHLEPVVLLFHAYSLFVEAKAPRAAAKVGADIAEFLLGFLCDPEIALGVLDCCALRWITQHRILDLEVSTRMFRAVLLAYAGDADGATSEMAGVSQYEHALDIARATELRQLRLEVHEILGGKRPLPVPPIGEAQLICRQIGRRLLASGGQDV